MIEFSEHAKETNKKRKIPVKWILQTVRNPEETFRSYRSRKLRRRAFGGKILEVVTKTEGPKITIVTAYFLKEKNES